jgi:hypothetical protein
MSAENDLRRLCAAPSNQVFDGMPESFGGLYLNLPASGFEFLPHPLLELLVALAARHT